MMRFILALLFVLTFTNQSTAALVSWYGPGFHHKKTASGEIFNMYAYTAASKTLKFGTKIRLTYHGRSVMVRVNDRGPYVRGRVLDISYQAAKTIGCAGVCDMKMEIK